jgi:hypothetical protein
MFNKRLRCEMRELKVTWCEQVLSWKTPLLREMRGKVMFVNSAVTGSNADTLFRMDKKGNCAHISLWSRVVLPKRIQSSLSALSNFGFLYLRYFFQCQLHPRQAGCQAGFRAIHKAVKLYKHLSLSTVQRFSTEPPPGVRSISKPPSLDMFCQSCESHLPPTSCCAKIVNGRFV